jgi:hypothetical protein
VRHDGADWRWLGDPLPDVAGFVVRALNAQKHPAFMYRTTIWTLTREMPSRSADAAGRGLALGLRFDADGVTQGAWILTPVWLVRRARLQRRVEAIAVEMPDPRDVAFGVERLLSEAAAVIDAAVST